MCEFAIENERFALLKRSVEDSRQEPDPSLFANLAWHLRQRDAPLAKTIATGIVREQTSNPKTSRSSPSAHLRATLVLTEVEYLTGDGSLALELGQRAVTLAKECRDLISEADAHFLLALIHQQQGKRALRRQELQLAQECALGAGEEVRDLIFKAELRSLELWEGGSTRVEDSAYLWTPGTRLSPAAAPWVHHCAYFVYTAAEDHESTSRHLILGAEAAARTGQVVREVTALSHMGVMYGNLEDFEQAMTWLLRAWERARSVGWPLLVAMQMTQLGNAFLAIGRIEAAIEMLTDAIAMTRDGATSRGGAIPRLYLAEALNRGEQYERALEILSQLEPTDGGSLQFDLYSGSLRAKAKALSGLGRRAEAATTALWGLQTCRQTRSNDWMLMRALLDAAKVMSESRPRGHKVRGSKRAVTYLMEAVELAESNDKLASFELYEACALAHFDLKSYARAYGFLSKAVKARERSLTASVMKQATALQIAHQTERARAEAQHHRELAATLQRSNESLEKIASIGQEITCHLSDSPIFETLSSHAGNLLDAFHVSIYVLDDLGTELKRVAGVEDGKTLHDDAVDLDDPSSLAARCVREGRLLSLQSTDSDPVGGTLIEGTIPCVSLMFSPLRTSSGTLGVMSVQSPRANAYGAREEQIFLSLCAYGAIGLANARSYRSLQIARADLEEKNKLLQQACLQQEQASQTDFLTGLRNRRSLTQQLDSDAALIARQASTSDGTHRFRLWMFLVDLDHFKAVNDQHGHGAGDLVLQQIGERLGAVARQSDYVVRWGGEEFLYVARMSEPCNPSAVAERIRAAIADQPFEIGPALQLHKTCSIGFAPCNAHAATPVARSWENAVEMADRALYVAKHEGRNRWVGYLEENAVRPAARGPQ